MTRTLLNDNDRAEVLDRLRRVRPDSARRWGTLSAARMLCHLADSLRVALGQIPVTPTHSFITRTVLKHVVVNTSFKAPPGKIQTAPEMLSTSPADWAQDLRSCEELAARVGAGEASSVHPKFGRLSAQEWGRLCWKHLDHHLRQFGV